MKLYIIIDNSDECWETLADVYQSIGIDGMVRRAEIEFPEICIVPALSVEQVDGEVQDESDKYIATFEDYNIGEILRVYIKD